jgi:hypothetical protein
VPWPAAETTRLEPSVSWAVLYLVVTLLPTGALLWQSRLGRRRAGSGRA